MIRRERQRTFYDAGRIRMLLILRSWNGLRCSFCHRMRETIRSEASFSRAKYELTSCFAYNGGGD